MTYVIKDWDKYFETTESRKLKKLHWTAFPNKHDGSGYKMLWKQYPEDAVEVFCAFVLMVEVASKCPIRGRLVNNDNEPLTAEMLSLKTEAPEAIFTKAFTILKKLGWLKEISETSENLRNLGKSPYTLHNITEHNITGHNREVLVSAPEKVGRVIEQKPKDKYLDFVLLTKEEYKKLVDRFGVGGATEMIERLNNYGHQKPKKFREYASHYHTILNWAAKDQPKQSTKPVCEG